MFRDIMPSCDPLLNAYNTKEQHIPDHQALTLEKFDVKTRRHFDENSGFFFIQLFICIAKNFFIVYYLFYYKMFHKNNILKYDKSSHEY